MISWKEAIAMHAVGWMMSAAIGFAVFAAMGMYFGGPVTTYNIGEAIGFGVVCAVVAIPLVVVVNLLIRGAKPTITWIVCSIPAIWLAFKLVMAGVAA